MPEAMETETARATINSALGGDHLAIFSRAVMNTLETEISEGTFAQIIDGLPIASVVLDTAGDTLPNDHPVHKTHKKLCPGVLEKARGFRDRFDPGTLQVNATVRMAPPSCFWSAMTL
ncbi:hypothetical protein IMZ48_31030 [Candidatus Bathyarchaeota archaeon]|nr:hypothetical protein [Candidatus Bathyarchaeota archaeon]